MEIPKNWDDCCAGIAKNIVKEGTGESPAEGQTVDLNYRLRKSDYSVLEEHWNKSEDEVFDYVLGKPGKLAQVSAALLTMKKGEHAVLKLEASVLEGESEEGLSKETGFVEVELLDFRDTEPTKFDVPWEERGPKAEEFKSLGNECLKANDLDGAMKRYEQAFDMIDWIKEERFNKLKTAIVNNQCLVLMKQKNWKELVKMSDKALEFDKTNAKAYQRKARALRELQMFSESEATLNELLNILPNDAEALEEKKSLAEARRALAKKEASMFSGMFKGGLYKDVIAPELEDPSDPSVFLSVKIGDAEPKRMVFKIFKKLVPKTAQNFLELCNPEGKDSQGPLTFLGSAFHRIIAGFMAQGGDFDKGNGTGGRSIYGEKFADENFKAKHSERGLLSMANAGPNTNGSQFFILFAPAPHLDGKHVVFGKLIEGFDCLDEMEKIKTGPNDVPADKVVIESCGVLQ